LLVVNFILFSVSFSSGLYYPNKSESEKSLTLRLEMWICGMTTDRHCENPRTFDFPVLHWCATSIAQSYSPLTL